MVWKERPFDAVRRELSDSVDGNGRPLVRLDSGRAARTGVPEFILAANKSIDEIQQSLATLAARIGRSTATRCRDEQLDVIPGRLADEFQIEVDREGRAITVAMPGRMPPVTGGKVGIITAGSSDVPVAAEAAVITREMGCNVLEVRDVGVAGLHRLVRPLEALAAAVVHAIIVVAGMDGALPSVVAGLVPVPVIGLPTSTGYGFGGGGTGALTTMLQSCAPGLVVVNIDNGVGAGSAAAKIANQVALAAGVVSVRD
jgi:NCAIR mutase (PurE)-related protein